MLYTGLRDEIAKAMKSQDKVRLSILRQVLGDIDAFAKDNKIKDVSKETVDDYIRKTLKQTTETYEASLKAGNDKNRTAMLAAQIAMLEEMLPKQVENDELRLLVSATISEIGATSMKDMGTIMSKLAEATGGNFNKCQAAQFAKESF